MEIELNKSVKERVFHAVIFEVTANVIKMSSGDVSLCLFQTNDKPAPLHLAFVADTRQQVDAFYNAALRAGGRDNGGPGLRSYGENYYAAFVISPDGHNIEAVCHAPESL